MENYQTIGDVKSGNINSDEEQTSYIINHQKNEKKEEEQPLFPKPEKITDEGVQRTGTVPNAIFNFTNAPMGAGLLSFAYAYRCCGLITGMLVSGLIIFLQYNSIHILNICIFDRKKNGIRTYQDCVEIYFGKFWKRICEVILLLYATGICVVYLVVLGQFVKPVIDFIFSSEEEDIFINRTKIIIVGLAIIIVFPLTLLREIKKLGASSFIALGGALYLSLFVIINGIIKIFKWEFGVGIEKTWLINTDLVSGFWPMIFMAFPIKCFGYQAQTVLFPLSYELKGGSSKKMDRIALMCIALTSFVYQGIGIFGFLSFGTETQDNILNNWSGGDILTNVGRFWCSVNVILSYPLQNFVARLALKSLIFDTFRSKKNKGKELGVITHLIVCIAMFAIIVLLALFMDKISLIFGFIGAIGAVSLMFAFPAAFAIKVVAPKIKDIPSKIYFYVLAVVLMIVAFVFCSTGLVATSLNLYEALKLMFGW